MCTSEDTLAQNLGALSLDDVMSHNEVTKNVSQTGFRGNLELLKIKHIFDKIFIKYCQLNFAKN